MKPLASTVLLLACQSLAFPALAAEKPLVLDVWPGKPADDDAATIGQEKFFELTVGGKPYNARLAKKKVSVMVTSTPSGAMIRVGNKSFGPTPSTIQVSEAESVTVTLAKDGYAPATQRITAVENGSPLHATLAPL